MTSASADSLMEPSALIVPLRSGWPLGRSASLFTSTPALAPTSDVPDVSPAYSAAISLLTCASATK